MQAVSFAHSWQIVPMSTTAMPVAILNESSDWTAADLVQRFGPMPLDRVRMSPAPGTASEEDVVRIHDSESRLFELVDGTLLEKSMGTWESCVAAILVRIMGTFVSDQDLGIILGADGMMRLAPGLVRIPDVSFISWNRFPNRRVPDEAIANIVPDLAVEILSRSNTTEEMARKLDDYLTHGVRLIWYIDPRAQEAKVYHGSKEFEVRTREQSLEGGDVLPGLVIPMAELFLNAPA